MTDPKQAAERLRQFAEEHEWTGSKLAKDVGTVARAYLAEHADDDVAIDDQFFADKDFEIMYAADSTGIWVSMLAAVRFSPPVNITTRGQLRRLMEALRG